MSATCSEPGPQNRVGACRTFAPLLGSRVRPQTTIKKGRREYFKVESSAPWFGCICSVDLQTPIAWHLLAGHRPREDSQPFPNISRIQETKTYMVTTKPAGQPTRPATRHSRRPPGRHPTRCMRAHVARDVSYCQTQHVRCLITRAPAL
jgi:hypothetical protein